VGIVLASAAHEGARSVCLTEPLDAAPALRIGDPEQRSYESMGIDRTQEFPASVIRLAGALRFSYATGEPVAAIADW
jgi:hypothetical protein